MQIENVMHLLIPCLTEDGRFRFKVKMRFKQMKFVKTLVNFQKNPKEPPCNILQRVKYITTVTVILIFIHCIMVSWLRQ